MSTRISLAVLLFAAAGCYGTVGDSTTPPPGTPPETTPPPPEPPPPAPAVYKRGSLTPLYHLTPRGEYGRFVHNNVNMTDTDFIATGNGFVSSAQKMDEISAQIGAERGSAVNIISDASDRQRAQQIPFRGNPSDVKLVSVAGKQIAAVPLGGDLMTPGNEVALVDTSTQAVTRVRVGIRPQRLAVTADSGLVFVCNQYSNYISIIDAARGELLATATGPVEVQTEFQCTDLTLVERDPAAHNPDKLDLYVANQWRASVLQYHIDVVRDPISNRAVDVRSQPGAEIAGVGTNPQRLSLGESADTLYVANSRGGELARIKLGDQSVTRIALGAPTIDVVQIDDALYIPTTTKDRGLLSNDEAALPVEVQSSPVVVQGLDGQPHQAHPGALFDTTRSYNFEDLRNGMFQVSSQLSGTATYFTDDISSEPNFSSQQKVLSGALPIAVVRNAAGTELFTAESGSAQVQELNVGSGNFRLTKGAHVFKTRERPFALALDEANHALWVADWGGELLEKFDTNSGARLAQIDLGYAALRYPATNIEKGEELFYDASWSNNGRKACATCHVDELLEDGIGYSNGATAPTAYHQVIPNWNQLTTDSYFWNGSFANGSYTSLALAAQTRTNCELVLFGLIEGVSSDPNTRIGDPHNKVTDGNDSVCRPQTVGSNGLPANFNTIKAEIAKQKIVAGQVILAATGLNREDAFRLVDFYSVSELRLPPNPLAYLKQQNQLDAATSAKIDEGQQLFSTAGCATCHDPTSVRHPFTDGLNHGSGADWASRFVNQYATDARIVNAIPGGIPQNMLEAIQASTPDHEINIHVSPIDYFAPFCFDSERCLSFDDPLLARGTQAETDRLNLMVQFNLGDPDRGFVPGNVPGQPQTNTPSLRGTWWKANLLHHGHAHSVAEAILAPGHPALRPGETGFAEDALGNIDVHGATSTMTQDQVDALVLYVSSIE